MDERSGLTAQGVRGSILLATAPLTLSIYQPAETVPLFIAHVPLREGVKGC
jgi:hypothetical protein